ncbi:unnamed protein product [Rotaria sp. Silwood1]|nr:unnamed protein product [Rotaria sp. Silwood1]
MGKSDKKKVSVGESVVPDGGWGWVIVFSSFLIHFIMDGITYSMGQVFLEPMRTKLSLDRASVSIVFSILPAITLGAVVTIEKSPRKSFFNQIIEQIDLNLLKNPAFTLFAVSNFLKNLGFNVIYNFSDDLANDLNVTKNQRIYIVMSVGLSSIFGRLIFGYIGDRKSMNRLFLFIITSIISGVATMVAPLSGSSIFLHIGYASLFGFFSGGSVTLTAIVLVDIVGISKLSDAFGVLLLFIGSAAALGTPIVGGLRDAFAHFPQPFLWPYLIVGSCTVVSGILLFAIPFLQRKKSSDDHMEIGCDAFYSAEDIPSQEQLQKF